MKARDYVELDVGTGGSAAFSAAHMPAARSCCSHLEDSQYGVGHCAVCVAGAAVSISSSGWEDVVVVSGHRWQCIF